MLHCSIGGSRTVAAGKEREQDMRQPKKPPVAPATSPARKLEAGEGGRIAASGTGGDNLAALAAASAALTESVEALGNEVMLYTRSSLVQAAETARALLGANTLADVLRLGNGFAAASIARLLDGHAKLAAIGVRLAAGALAPLGRDLAAAAERRPAAE
jgi:hypothetical protein